MCCCQTSVLLGGRRNGGKAAGAILHQEDNISPLSFLSVERDRDPKSGGWPRRNVFAFHHVSSSFPSCSLISDSVLVSCGWDIVANLTPNYDKNRFNSFLHHATTLSSSFFLPLGNETSTTIVSHYQPTTVTKGEEQRSVSAGVMMVSRCVTMWCFGK